MPDGGYVLADGLFRVSGDGRQVLDFALRTHCGGSVILPPMQVDATGAFAFDGHPPSTPSGTVVQITGRFVSSREARGAWKVSRDICRGQPVSFVAQLS